PTVASCSGVSGSAQVSPLGHASAPSRLRPSRNDPPGTCSRSQQLTAPPAQEAEAPQLVPSGTNPPPAEPLPLPASPVPPVAPGTFPSEPPLAAVAPPPVPASGPAPSSPE